MAATALPTYGEPFPIDQLAALPRFTSPRLSPDGTMMCAIVRQGTTQSLMEIAFNGLPPREIARFNQHGRLKNFWWSGSDLLLDVTDERGGEGFRSLDLRTGTISFLDREKTGTLGQDDLLQWRPDRPESFLFESDDDILGAVAWINPVWFDVHTGRLDKVKVGFLPNAVQHWIVNEKGEAVAGRGELDDKAYYVWRATPDRPWERRELGTADNPDMILAGIASDQKRLLAYDYTDGGRERVVAFDPAIGTKEVLFSDPEVEADSLEHWGQDQVRVRGVRYEVDWPDCHYFDKADAAVAASLNAALPGTVNQIVSVSLDEQLLVVLAWSDRDRGTYYLLDRKQKRLVVLGPQFAGNFTASCRPSRRFAFKSRDGLQLHARLTLPGDAGKGKPPLVVMTSYWLNTPRVRLEFDSWVQLLATRGYAVAEVETRGTPGYGRALVRAGDFEAGEGIPNDLADCTRFLIHEGLVDEHQVALLGRRWGGLIAIHAIANNPGLYSLWLNFDTPVDLRYLRPENLAISTNNFRVTVKMLGSRSVGEKILKKLDPTDLVPRFNIPSFHYYQGFDGSYYAAGREMQKLLDQGVAEHELFDHQLPKTYTVEAYEAYNRDCTADCATRMLAFLDAHFHPNVAGTAVKN